jgi:hypothetical protein
MVGKVACATPLSVLAYSTDIRVTGIEYIGDRLEKLGSCHKVTYTPTCHRVGFGKSIDANNSPLIKFVMRKQRARTDMYTLEKDFIISKCTQCSDVIDRQIMDLLFA